MKLPYNIVLPFPPSVNTLYFQGPKHGQKFLSKKGKEYKKMIHMLYASDDNEPTELPLLVIIDLYPPDKRLRDVDNYSKAVLDGLTDLNLIKDDSQIIGLHVHKHDKLETFNKGLAFVCVYECSIPTVQEETINLSTIEKVISSLHEEEFALFHKPLQKYIKKKDRIDNEEPKT